MRSFIRRAIVVGCCLATAVIWSGCKSKEATEYVAGISTQVTVPRDLKVVRVDVNVSGIPQFCQGYKVYNGVVQLPRSLGSYPQREASLNSGPITYTIVGFTEDVDLQGANPLFAACAAPKIGSDGARILRRSRQPYIPDEILFLPMPLKYSCFDKACDDENQTCKGGKCVNAELSAEQAKLAFPKYAPELVDGTGGQCFNIDTCMGAKAPPVIVDSANCIFAVPNTPSAPAPLIGANPFSGPSSGDGVNVEVTYDGGLNKEILDGDPDEGFTIPDPVNKPQQFKLAPGLCEMLKGVDDKGNPTPHRISAIKTSGTCQTKKTWQPFCAGSSFFAQMGLDANGQEPQPPAEVCSSVELKPPPAALVVVVDSTLAHQQFFAAVTKQFNQTDEESFVEPAIKLALSDPAFQKTDIGLVYAGNNATCSAGAPEIPPEKSATARDKILADLKAKQGSLAVNPVAIEGGLHRAYTELQGDKYKDYFRRAVLVLGNGGFTEAGVCSDPGGPLELATSASTNARKVDTYVVQFTKDPAPIPPETAGTKSTQADALAAAGGTGLAAYRVNEAKVKFQDIVNSLGTCVYDVTDNAAAPKDTDSVSFVDPLSGVATKIDHNAGCGAGEGTPGKGWAYATNTAGLPANTKRIFLCKESCDVYRKSVSDVASFAGIYFQTPPPIPVFAFRKACQ